MSFNPFAGGIIQRVAPTTQAQREVLASAQMNDEANTAFNEAVAIKILGPIAVERLSDSLNALVARHETLSVTFSRRGDEICLQDSKFSLQHIDLREQSGTEQEAYLQHLKRNIAISPMNLEEGPLFFAWLVDLGVNEEGVLRSELILAVHHLVCDGWTLGLLLNELSRIYENNGLASCLEPAPSFLDYAERQQASAATNRDIDYWKAAFEHIPANMDLPLDFPRPAHRTFSAKRLDFEIGKDLSERLKGASASLKSSQVNIVLASYFLLLQKLSRNDDLVVGLPVAGQAATDQHALAGHMVQLLPIRLQMSDTWSFRDLLHSVKSRVLDASERPNFTFGELVKDMPVDRSRVPLINTIFNIDQAMPSLKFGDARGVVETVPRAAENFEMFLNVMPHEDGLTVETTYSTALFREETIQSWMNTLAHLLSQGLEAPDTLLSKFTLSAALPDAVRRMNETDACLDHPDLLEAIQSHVRDCPGAPAVKAGNKVLSYRALWDGVRQMATALQQRGVAENDVIGICCARDEHLLVSTLAVHLIGAAYLPLDPGFPEDRLVYMLKDSGAKAVIGDDAAERLFGSHGHVPIYSFDQLAEGEQVSELVIPPRHPERLAYLIYTSGSTGMPKGVAIGCHAMANFVDSMAKKPGCVSTDVLLAVTTLAFDISVLELFVPLICGACVVIASDQETKDGEMLSELIRQHDVSIMQATPATWRLLLASSWSNSRYARFKALCGGEPLPRTLATDLLEHVSELWNMFGPTETTVWSSCKQIELPCDQITVGSAIQNTKLYILDEQGSPVPMSVPGEICIGGQGLAAGYHERAELTHERFVEHPVYGRIYRTGDLGKWLVNGELEHLGRMDDQVKVRGYRIELGEIEVAVADQVGIDRAVVYLWKLTDEDVRIVACCIPQKGSTIQATQLRKSLRDRLPAYMIPQYFLSIDQVPLTPNGKVDKKGLPRPEVNVSSLVSGQLNSDTEKALAEIWANLIQSSVTIGREDTFFEVGGHSLLALEAVRQIERRFGLRFSMKDLIASKLSVLADQIENSADQISSESNIEIKPIDQGRALSPEQNRMFVRQQAFPSTLCNNLKAMWRLQGSLSQAYFEQSLKRVVEKQTALRTCLRKVDGQVQQFLFSTESQRWLEVLDFSSESQPFDVANRYFDERFQIPYDLLDAPLAKFYLVKLSASEHLFVLTAHQVIFDGWSYDIVLKELSSCYQSMCENRAPVLERSSFEYRDFTESLEASESKLIDDARRDYFEDAMNEVLCASKLVKGTAKGTGIRRKLAFDQATLTQLEAFCKTHDLREYEVLFGISVVSLACCLGEGQVKFGIPVSGRYRSDVIDLVGSFVSTLPVVFNVNNGNLLDVFNALKQQLKSFYDLQEGLSFGTLCRAFDYSEHFPSNLMPVSFGFQDVRNRGESFFDLRMTQEITSRHETELPIELWTRIEKSGLSWFFDYDSGLVESSFIDEYSSQINRWLTELSSGDTVQVVVPGQTQKKSVWRRLFR